MATPTPCRWHSGQLDSIFGFLTFAVIVVFVVSFYEVYVCLPKVTDNKFMNNNYTVSIGRRVHFSVVFRKII